MGQWMAVTIQQVADTATYRDVMCRAWYNSTEGVGDSSNSFSTSGDFPDNASGVSKSISIPFGGGSQKIHEKTLRVNKAYGASTDVHFAASLSGIDHWGGGQVYDSATYTVPARAYDAPAQPSLVVWSRSSDTSHTISWTRNATSSAPYVSQRVQRSINNGAWSTIANVAGTTVSYVDATTIANRNYQWRIVAVNAAGETPSGASSVAYTTPGDPSDVQATLLPGGDVRLDFAENVFYGVYGHRVEHSDDGGVSWALLTNLSVGVTTHTHASPSPTDPHRYRVRSAISFSSIDLHSDWVLSNTIQLAAPPNPPANLSPSGARDATEDIAFSWLHNPVDTSAQSKFQIRHRADSLDSWTTEAEVVSSVSEWTLPADTYSNGEVPEWEVRTWGQHADPSPWSATASFPTYARPTVAISAPSNGATLTDSALSVDWSYFQAETFPQSQWRATLSNGDGSVVETRTGSGTTSSVAFETAVKDGASYTIRVEGRASFGMWSMADEVTVDVSYLPPSEVLVAPTFDRDSGAALLALSRESWDDVETVEPVMVTVERSVDDGSTWVLVARNLSITGPDLTIPDALPLTRGTTLYRTIATSATPSSVTSDPVELEVNETERAYLNYGPGFGTALTFYGNLSLSSNAGRAEVVENFAGRVGSTNRPAGVLISGETRSREVGVAATLLRADGFATHEDFEDAALTGGVMAYRDPTGRRMFGRFTLGGTSTQWAPLADVTFTITELGHTA